MRKLFVIFLAALLLTACKKDAENADCILLKEGIKAKDLQQVNTAITKYINRLPTDDYTEANVNNLIQAISGKCGLTANLFCFDCVKTLPSQTEIYIEFTDAGTTIRKTIDLTYTNGTNKMKFGNMHD